MPLEHAKEGTPGFSRNIKREEAAGKPQDQAVAIAYSMSRSGARERAHDRLHGHKKERHEPEPK